MDKYAVRFSYFQVFLTVIVRVSDSNKAGKRCGTGVWVCCAKIEQGSFEVINFPFCADNRSNSHGGAIAPHQNSHFYLDRSASTPHLGMVEEDSDE